MSRYVDNGHVKFTQEVSVNAFKADMEKLEKIKSKIKNNTLSGCDTFTVATLTAHMKKEVQI